MKILLYFLKSISIKTENDNPMGKIKFLRAIILLISFISTRLNLSETKVINKNRKTKTLINVDLISLLDIANPARILPEKVVTINHREAYPVEINGNL